MTRIPEGTSASAPTGLPPRRRRRAILAAAALAAAVAVPVLARADLAWESGPDLPRVAERILGGGELRVVAFGSSSTQGVGASGPAASYPERLQSVLRRALPSLSGKVTVLNRGVGGEDVDDMLKRIDRDVIDARPDLVIWQTGSNDPLRGVGIEHFREETEAGVRRMREAGIDVMLMEPQWCPKLDAVPGSDRFRDAVREIGEELDVPVIRRSDMMKEWIASSRLTPKEMFAPDGLHMADGGYAQLARSAAAEIIDGSKALEGENGEAAATAIED